jgi:hypothetical protein
MNMSGAGVPAWSGPKSPRTAAVPRRPGQVRRTTSVDMVFAEGPRGPLWLHGRARDVITAADGRGVVLAEASLDALASPSRELLELRTSPHVAGLDALIGRRVATGFRAAAAGALGAAHAGSGLALLLDDLPITAMIAGVGWMRVQIRAEGQKRIPQVERIGTCAGWRPGGAAAARALHQQPGLHPDVAAAPRPEDEPGDPDAWHPMPPLPPRAMRRRRRLDVVPGDPAALEAWFRDAIIEEDGSEAALHEYTVRGFVDVNAGVVMSLDTTAHVLPYVDCPGAVPSSHLLDGTPLHQLGATVRERLGGEVGCTHLNDALRSIADVDHLLRLAASG